MPDEKKIEENIQQVVKLDKEIMAIAKKGISHYKQALKVMCDTNKGEKKETPHYKTFEEHSREELIDLALEEIDWMVIGGQDGEEYYNSIQFIRRVLRSLK